MEILIRVLRYLNIFNCKLAVEKFFSFFTFLLVSHPRMFPASDKKMFEVFFRNLFSSVFCIINLLKLYFKYSKY